MTEPLLEHPDVKDTEQRETSFSRVPHQRGVSSPIPHCPTGLRSLTFWGKGFEPHEESRVHFISTAAHQLPSAEWIKWQTAQGEDRVAKATCSCPCHVSGT